VLNIASLFHVDHELVDFVPVVEPEYDEVIEEYEEEIFAQEEAQEPVGADFADPAPAQGKPRCITPIFNDHRIYLYDMHLRYRHCFWKLYA
jgi:hypothetical protein